MPEVSVVIPTYNSASYLIEAVESVLAQTYQDFEVLVIDDGSTDETEQIMRRYQAPVRYIRQQNGGVSVARNRGIAESRGRYVAFLDADDIWLPHKLARQIAALRQQPHDQVCYSAFTVVDFALNPIEVRRSQRQGSALEDLLTRGNVVATPSTVLCERTLFDSVGSFDPALSQCADWDMWVRLAARTEFLYLDEPLVTYRQHSNNMSRNAPLLEYDSVQVLSKGFAMPELPESLHARRQAALARNYMVLAGTYFHAQHYRDFVLCVARAVTMDVHQIRYLTAFPQRMAARLKTRNLSEAA
ncbi:MAG: glycosyltransferase [Acidobacteria bacterium]|nr:glycosyltransferase [Acidobacteriota bacterium]